MKEAGKPSPRFHDKQSGVASVSDNTLEQVHVCFIFVEFAEEISNLLKISSTLQNERQKICFELFSFFFSFKNIL